MGKHTRRTNNRLVRNSATATAVAAGATAVMVNPAVAAEIAVPNLGTIQVPDLPGAEGLLDASQLPQIPDIPEIPADIFGQAHNDLSSVVGQVAQSNPIEQQIVDIARSKVGSPYVWGASGPNAFDCSGFTSWVYSQVGKSIPRTSQAQAGAGQKVSLDDLQPGDIIAYYGGASHVAIYVGNGTIIDALQTGTPVGERPLHYMPIHSAFRF